MNEIFFQKIAECTKNGDLKIDDAEVFQEYLDYLYNLPKTVETMEVLLNIGKVCLEQNRESIALKIYQKAYFYLSPLDCSDKCKLEYAQTIFSAFCTLNSSNNEYIWESTGEFIHACRDFINKLSPGTIK